jgi:hypothetical protein
LIREEAMSRRYHEEEIRDCLFDPEKPAESQFRVDRPLWMSLGKELLPFGKGIVGKFFFCIFIESAKTVHLNTSLSKSVVEDRHR